MKNGRRAFRVILAILLLLALVPVTGFARSDATAQTPETRQSTGADASRAVSDVTNSRMPAEQPADAPRQTWSLLNLVLTLLTVAAAVALSLGIFGGGSSRLQALLRNLALLPAGAAVLLFLFTENMGSVMVVTDANTGWILGIALIQACICVLLGRVAARRNAGA